MINNFILSGFIAKYSGLKEVEGKNGFYHFITLDIHVDDATQQSVTLTLTGEMAVQLSTCNIEPNTPVNAFLRLYIRSFKDNNGIERKVNDIRCWKLDVYDDEGTVAFTCRKNF